MFSDSIFLFCVYSELPPSPEYNSSASFGDYEITFPSQTPFTRAFLDGRELLILGLAADVRNGQWDNLPQTMLESTQSLQDVICYEAHLGGKYILFYKDVSGTYAIPDATASIPFCYTTKGNPLLCASDSEAIAAALSLSPNAELLHIRNSGDLSQAMPYDLTVYEEVLQLLPNHYYSFAEQKAFRFVNFKSKQSVLSAKEAAAQTAPLIKNLLNYYSKQFPLQCPLTSGWDSRVVLSTMLSMDEKVETYTIRHDHFSATEPDVVIPQKIAEAFSVTNIQIPDMHPHTQLCEEFSSKFGATGYSLRTLMIANTIKSVYGDCAVINGDIIGQVGKCSLHRDISEKFATAKYFRCKLHNYSKASVKHVDRWLADIRAAGERVNVFDLFSMESRMGRWAAQENLIYGMLGQKYLNIFNSRAIVYPWTCVPREDRKLSCIHKALIHMTYPELMRIPVDGKPSLAEQITKHNGLTYYLASFVKYYFEKAIFLCKKR